MMVIIVLIRTSVPMAFVQERLLSVILTVSYAMAVDAARNRVTDLSMETAPVRFSVSFYILPFIGNAFYEKGVESPGLRIPLI